MKLLKNDHSVIRWFKKRWAGLVEPTSMGNAREHHLSRTLNIILLLLFIWGIVFEIQFQLDNRPFHIGDFLAILMVAILALAYYLNRLGQFSTAVLLTLSILIASTFAFALMQPFPTSNNLSILYYLIIAILMSELFFSIRGYVITTGIVLAGVFGISLVSPGTESIF